MFPQETHLKKAAFNSTKSEDTTVSDPPFEKPCPKAGGAGVASSPPPPQGRIQGSAKPRGLFKTLCVLSPCALNVDVSTTSILRVTRPDRTLRIVTFFLFWGVIFEWGFLKLVDFWIWECGWKIDFGIDGWLWK